MKPALLMHMAVSIEKNKKIFQIRSHWPWFQGQKVRVRVTDSNVPPMSVPPVLLNALCHVAVWEAQCSRPTRWLHKQHCTGWKRSEMSPMRSAWPDGIRYPHIKQLSEKGKSVVAEIINTSMMSGEIEDDHRDCRQTVLLKPFKDHGLLKGYRIITMANVLVKLMKKWQLGD